MEQEVVLHVPRELLDHVRHVADLLLQLLDLVLELLGLLHGGVDLLAAESGDGVVKLAARTKNIMHSGEYVDKHS